MGEKVLPLQVYFMDKRGGRCRGGTTKLERITFTVPGAPVPKGRPRFTMSGHSYTPPKTAAYEQLVRECYLKAKQPKLTGSLKVMLLAYFPIPKSTPKKLAALMRDGKMRHVKRPDVDNVAKAILDALNGVAFDDDSSVYSLFIAKRYEDDKGPRVVVRIREEA